MRFRGTSGVVFVVAMVWLLTGFAAAATIAPPKKPRAKSRQCTETPTTQKKMARGTHSTRSAASAAKGPSKATTRASAKGKKKSKYHERFYASSFANGQTDGDKFDGEDAIVREAAIEALGNMNGTVVSIDPDSGRILAMVNQKLALPAGRPPA